MTRVCIPTVGQAGLRDTVCEHFGRAGAYTFVDNETGAVDVVVNTTLHVGGEGYPPDLIARHGGEAMLCGGLGRRAVAMFEEAGIAVCAGASGTVADAMEQWRSGRLQTATRETACQEHAFRNEEHAHHGHHG
ncbi:MAG: NifB/NifX family molybdenum-iron cluster-binding protein [Actinomycetota bacterium]